MRSRTPIQTPAQAPSVNTVSGSGLPDINGGPGGERMTNDAWQVEVFYDGQCPLCMREMRMLRRHDTREQIRFSDISEADFDGAGTGLSRETLMRKLHGRLPDGRIIEGVEVFRRLYAAVGLGRLVRVSRLPGIAQLLDAAYALFARNRLRLTGRCEDGVCALPTSISSFD